MSAPARATSPRRWPAPPGPAGAGVGRRHLRIDAGPCGARRSATAGRVLTDRRATTSLPRQHFRRGDRARRAATDSASGGRPDGDGAGAETGRKAGHHGPRRRKQCAVLADAASRRGPCIRRRRNRRHPRRQRLLSACESRTPARFSGCAANSASRLASPVLEPGGCVPGRAAATRVARPGKGTQRPS